MKLRWIEPGQSIGARRGEVVVCIPVHAGHELLVRCLRSVLSHTSPSVPIMICDDASPDIRSQEFVRGLGDGTSPRRLFYARTEQNVGFPSNVNAAFTAAAPADVVVLNSDCVVAEGWLEGLRGAAYASGRVATATALTNHGSIASIPDLRQPRPALPDGWELDDAAAAIRLRSRRIRPRVPTAIGHCMFIRRTALELVGDFDLTFTPGYGEEVDFSQRCLLNGLCHVLADDVLVLHHGGGSFGASDDRHLVQDAHEQILATRYPYYHDGLRSLERTAGPLSLALNVARRALTGLAVTVDMEGMFDSDSLGSRRRLELLRALAQTEQVRLIVVLPDHRTSEARVALAGLSGVTLLTADQARRPDLRADVVHRLTSIRRIEDMRRLRTLGERVVLTAEDLVRYHNPADFRDFQAWDQHRASTRDAMALADRIVFLSDCARLDAVAEGLVEDARATTVHAGVDRSLARAGHSQPPADMERFLGHAEAVLCVGPRHGQAGRDFALRLVAQLRCDHDWPGRLVLVGPQSSNGTSVPSGDERLATLPGETGDTLCVAAVTGPERQWLLRRCRLVLHTAIAEDSTSIVFEAAEHGVPCMWAPDTALSELIPDYEAAIVPWDAELSAGRAFDLLREDSVRADNVAAVNRAASRLTWKASAERLLDVYDDTYGAAEVRASRQIFLEQATLQPTSEAAALLDDALPDQATRPLLALATHPRVGTPVFRVLELGYRASHRLRRRRHGNGDGEL